MNNETKPSLSEDGIATETRENVEADYAKFRVYFCQHPGAPMLHNSSWSSMKDAEIGAISLQEKGYGTEIRPNGGYANIPAVADGPAEGIATASEVLPCPFCGVKADYHRASHGGDSVSCRTCNASISGSPVHPALPAWNKRVEPVEPAAPVVGEIQTYTPYHPSPEEREAKANPSQPAPVVADGKGVFDQIWKDFIAEAEVEPSPEEEGFARWGWDMASGDYANGYIDGREAGYHMCGSCSHPWEAHDGECGAYMSDGSICGCQKVIQAQPAPLPSDDDDNFTAAARFAGITPSQVCQFHLMLQHLLGKGPAPGFLKTEPAALPSDQKETFEQWWDTKKESYNPRFVIGLEDVARAAWNAAKGQKETK